MGMRFWFVVVGTSFCVLQPTEPGRVGNRGSGVDFEPIAAVRRLADKSGFANARESGNGCVSRSCSTGHIVHRLRGGVIMGDESFSLFGSWDSDAQDQALPNETPVQNLARTETCEIFKSNVVMDQGLVMPFQPHPDTLRERLPVDDAGLLQQAKEAVRIPMGGGAAVLTPMVARHVSRVALSVFKKEISPILHRTSSRFAAVVASPFRRTVTDTPKDQHAPTSARPPEPTTDTNSALPEPYIQQTPPRVRGDAILKSADAPVAPVAPEGARAGLVARVFDALFTQFFGQLGGAIRAKLNNAVHCCLGLDAMALGTALVGYLVPGALFILRVLLWFTLHSMRTVALVLVDSFSSSPDVGTHRRRPAWTSATPFPCTSPLPASWQTPRVRTSARAAGQLQAPTPPPRYSAVATRAADRRHTKNELVQDLTAHKSDHTIRQQQSQSANEELGTLAREHRARLQQRDTEDGAHVLLGTLLRSPSHGPQPKTSRPEVPQHEALHHDDSSSQIQKVEDAARQTLEAECQGREAERLVRLRWQARAKEAEMDVARLREQLETLRARQHAAAVGERACSPKTEDEDEGDSANVHRGQWGKKRTDARTQTLGGPWWDGGTPMVRAKLKKGHTRQQFDQIRLPQQHAHIPPPAPTSASVLPWARTGAHMSPQPPSSPPSPRGDDASGHEQADAVSVPPQQGDVAVAAPRDEMRASAPGSWVLPRLLDRTSPHPSGRSRWGSDMRASVREHNKPREQWEEAGHIKPREQWEEAGHNKPREQLEEAGHNKPREQLEEAEHNAGWSQGARQLHDGKESGAAQQVNAPQVNGGQLQGQRAEAVVKFVSSARSSFDRVEAENAGFAARGRVVAAGTLREHGTPARQQAAVPRRLPLAANQVSDPARQGVTGARRLSARQVARGRPAWAAALGSAAKERALDASPLSDEIDVPQRAPANTSRRPASKASVSRSTRTAADTVSGRGDRGELVSSARAGAESRSRDKSFTHREESSRADQGKVQVNGLGRAVGEERPLAAEVASAVKLIEARVGAASAARLDKVLAYFRSSRATAAEKVQSALLQLGGKLLPEEADALVRQYKAAGEQHHGDQLPAAVCRVLQKLV